MPYVLHGEELLYSLPLLNPDSSLARFCHRLYRSTCSIELCSILSISSQLYSLCDILWTEQHILPPSCLHMLCFPNYKQQMFFFSAAPVGLVFLMLHCNKWNPISCPYLNCLILHKLTNPSFLLLKNVSNFIFRF